MAKYCPEGIVSGVSGQVVGGKGFDLTMMGTDTGRPSGNKDDKKPGGNGSSGKPSSSSAH